MITATAKFTPNPTITPRLRAALVPAANLAAEMVADEARRLAPVDTGALQESIRALESQADGDQVTVKVVADIYYAGYVEYGTGQRGAGSPGAGPGPYDPNWPGMVAQPYMRPALDTVRGDVMAVIGREVASALK